MHCWDSWPLGQERADQHISCFTDFLSTSDLLRIPAVCNHSRAASVISNHSSLSMAKSHILSELFLAVIFDSFIIFVCSERIKNMLRAIMSQCISSCNTRFFFSAWQISSCPDDINSFILFWELSSLPRSLINQHICLHRNSHTVI